MSEDIDPNVVPGEMRPFDTPWMDEHPHTLQPTPDCDAEFEKVAQAIEAEFYHASDPELGCRECAQTKRIVAFIRQAAWAKAKGGSDE